MGDGVKGLFYVEEYCCYLVVGGQRLMPVSSDSYESVLSGGPAWV